MKITTEESTNTEELRKKIAESTSHHISKIEEEDLLILKGHLLVESALRDYCKSKTVNHSAFDKAKLSFTQLLHLTQALNGELDKEKWALLKNLNTLRNQIAHQLDSQNSLEENKLKLLNSFDPDEFIEFELHASSDLHKLKHIVVNIYAYLVTQLHITKIITINIDTD